MRRYGILPTILALFLTACGRANSPAPTSTALPVIPTAASIDASLSPGETPEFEGAAYSLRPWDDEAAWAETDKALSALMPSRLDKAFKGEL